MYGVFVITGHSTLPVNTAKFFWPIGPKDRICGCKNLQVLYQLKAKSEAANT